MSERSLAPPRGHEHPELEQRYKVATEGAEVVGFRLVVNNDKAGEMVIKLRAGKDTLVIEGIQVEKEFRRRGFGTQLVRSAEEIARVNSLNRIEIRPYATDESAMSTPRLRKWYSSIGYTGTSKLMHKAC